ncbi:hypothetical protein QF031_000309 [Pseudarthrobacter defluvii]|nr:hypothetical protein [Pseudarthrobacter defluvii]
MMSCSTAVSDGSRLGCWKMMPTFARRSAVSSLSFRPAVSVPSMITRPLVGRTRVAAVARRLDFPDPEGPTSATS